MEQDRLLRNVGNEGKIRKTMLHEHELRREIVPVFIALYVNIRHERHRLVGK